MLRRRLREHRERVLVRGLAGYLTSLAALLNVTNEEWAYKLAARRTHGYLVERKTSFVKVVRKKRTSLV